MTEQAQQLAVENGLQREQMEHRTHEAQTSRNCSLNLILLTLLRPLHCCVGGDEGSSSVDGGISPISMLLLHSGSGVR